MEARSLQLFEIIQDFCLYSGEGLDGAVRAKKESEDGNLKQTAEYQDSLSTDKAVESALLSSVLLIRSTAAQQASTATLPEKTLFRSSASSTCDSGQHHLISHIPEVRSD